MKKRLLSLLMATIFVAALIPMCFVGASAAPTELEVKWNEGAVGGCTNSKKNQITGGYAGYIYSDIITVPKAGTKISYSDNSSSHTSHTIYAFSTWKKSGSDWVVDIDGANVSGTFAMEGIGQKPSANGVDYTFITDHDNQAIRLCVCCGGLDKAPKVYTEPTTEKSTLQQINDRNFTATLDPDGTIKNLKWSCGYASSASNTNGSAKEVRYASDQYAVSGMFTVPKAGTKISYTFSESANSAYNAFTRYKKVGDHYTYDIGFSATDNQVTNGSTKTYITQYDNEVLRICVRPQLAYKTIDIEPPVSVSWAATTEPPTATHVKKTKWVDPEFVSLVTAAPLIGKEFKDIKWRNGYVGSQYHDFASFTLTSPNNVDYYTTDVFTVPKAGTTIYFFDQTFTDFHGGSYSSTSAMMISHWKKSGNNWIFDKSKEYLNGCDTYNLLLDQHYRHYAYTTKEDNENVRICVRYAPMYEGEDPVIPPVYLIEKVIVDADTSKTGILNEVSYKDLSGDQVKFSLYFPKDYDAEKQYTLVFDNSEDGAISKSLADRRYKGMILRYTGDLDKSLRLLDAVVDNFPVRVSDILFAGNDLLAKHLTKYNCIRIAQAMVQTSGEAVKVNQNTPDIKQLSSFASAEEAADWLINKSESYYDVLEGIKMYAIGDSYFGGSRLGQHQTWVNLLGHKYGMTFHNYGIGGNTLAFASGIGSNQPPMCRRYTELPDGGDIYIIEGGRNDRHFSVPFGKNDDKHMTTIKGSINIIMNSIRKKNPDALIVLVTPWSYKGEKGFIGTNDDYANAIRELAEYYNDPHIVCLYAADTKFTGIDMANPVCRAKYCITANDVSHLNANGMYMVEPKFDRWIAEKYAALNNLTLVDSADGDKFSEAEPETTKPVETTVAPEDTTVPAEETTVPAEETTESKDKKGGCGSTVTVLGLVTVLICGSTVIFRKKD